MSKVVIYTCYRNGKRTEFYSDGTYYVASWAEETDEQIYGKWKFDEKKEMWFNHPKWNKWMHVDEQDLVEELMIALIQHCLLEQEDKDE